jgi:hypothetical protein
MTTAFLHRLLVIVPAARCAALNAFIKGGINPSGGDWFAANLSASGTAPATHAWASFAVTDAQGKILLGRLAQQAGLTQPASWDSFTRAQKRQWVLDQRAAVRTAIGVWLVPDNNDGAWSDPAAALAVLGLQLIQTPIGGRLA